MNQYQEVQKMTADFVSWMRGHADKTEVEKESMIVMGLAKLRNDAYEAKLFDHARHLEKSIVDILGSSTLAVVEKWCERNDPEEQEVDQ